MAGDEANSRVTMAERLTRIEVEQKHQAGMLAEIRTATAPIPVLANELQRMREKEKDHEDRLRTVERKTSGTWEVARGIIALVAGLLGGWGGAKGG